jgi:hypothetical protein
MNPQSTKNESKCPIFSDQQHGYLYLIFIEDHFRPYCSILGCESIVFNNTFAGRSLSGSPQCPQKFKIAAEIYNHQLGLQKSKDELSFLQLLYQYPALVYYFWPGPSPHGASGYRYKNVDITSRPVPVGAWSSVGADAIAITIPTTLEEEHLLFRSIPGYNCNDLDYDDLAAFYNAFADLNLSIPNQSSDQTILPLLIQALDPPNINAPVLTASDYIDCAALLALVKYRVHEWTSGEINNWLESHMIMVCDPKSRCFVGSNLTLDHKTELAREAFCDLHLDQKLAINQAYDNAMKSYNENAHRLEKPLANCQLAFKRFSDPIRGICRHELLSGDFNGALLKLNHHFANSAIASVTDIETAIKEIKMPPGLLLSTHLDKVTQQMRFFADVLQLSYEQTNHPDTYPVYRLNSELTDDNVGEMTDIEVNRKYRDCQPRLHDSPIFITEDKRKQLLITTLRKTRFEECIERFSEQPKQFQTMKILMERLYNTDGASHLELKRLAELTAMETNPKVNAAITGSGKLHQAKVGTYPAGSCKEHPSSTTHTFDQCSKNPVNAGKLPEKSLGKTSSSTQNSGSNKKPKIDSKSKLCSHCKSSVHPQLISIAGTHDSDQCRLEHDSEGRSYPTKGYVKGSKQPSSSKPDSTSALDTRMAALEAQVKAGYSSLHETIKSALGQE